MRYLNTLFVKFVDYLLCLSDRARLNLVWLAVVMLGGSAGYKLYTSLQNLSKPPPPVSVEEFIGPIGKVAKEGQASFQNYQQVREHSANQLDSLSKLNLSRP